MKFTAVIATALLSFAPQLIAAQDPLSGLPSCLRTCYQSLLSDYCDGSVTQDCLCGIEPDDADDIVESFQEAITNGDADCSAVTSCEVSDFTDAGQYLKNYGNSQCTSDDAAGFRCPNVWMAAAGVAGSVALFL